MAKVDEAFELRYKKKSKQVQVLVDFDKLQEYRSSPVNGDVYDVLADTKIYTDQKKGEIASDSLLNELFETNNEEEIIKEILNSGECQVPTSYVNELRKKKMTQIISYISENAFNPQTKTKYTYSMIERAIDEIKVHIDPFRSTQYQAEEIIKSLRKKIPISMETVIMIIKIPGMYCGSFYGKFRSYGKTKKEFFDENGNLHLHMEMPESSIDIVATYIKNNSNGEGEYHIAS